MYYIYITYNIYIFPITIVFILKMAVTAENCCSWLITKKVVYRLDLYLFY